ncbi:MAG TPA: L-rhamnose mutarotase [Vicinamibacterales bacterium]|nr:L-rhamnose mutarotase [Vicinamibacterales bacterium]
MTRHVLLVNLRDDPAAIAAYREHHRRVWPEVVESLRRAGVKSMDIHMLGRMAVMIVDVADGLDIRRVFASHQAFSPRVREWEQLMKSLQEPAPEAAPGEWWATMEPVFRMTEQAPAVKG